jgi:hypothetical protein
VTTTTRTRRAKAEGTSITSSATPRAKANAAALQQLGPDRALVVEGSQPPGVVGLRPFWHDWPSEQRQR